LQTCSLGCRFCFAGSALGRGGVVSAARLAPLFDACRSAPKATLLGGEPFEHSETDAILSAAVADFKTGMDLRLKRMKQGG